jgi:hypothetical protein
MDDHALPLNAALKVANLRPQIVYFSGELSDGFAGPSGVAAADKQGSKSGAAQKLLTTSTVPTRLTGRVRTGRQRGRVVSHS